MAGTKLSAIASEASPSVGDERLYLVQDLAGAPASKYIELGNMIFQGTTAPTTPQDDYLWHDTSSGIIWRYGTYAGSTRWVSATLYSVFTGMNQAATSANILFQAGVSPVHNYNIWVDNHIVHGHIVTTNSGSHYWNWRLRKVSSSTVPANGAGTLLGSGLSSVAESANVWFELTESIDAVIDRVAASVEMPFLDVYKTGSPGNAWFTQGFSYRLVYS